MALLAGLAAISTLSTNIILQAFHVIGKTWGEALARALSLTMIATAAAPGFSPLAGSLLSVTLGWAGNFILVGLAAIVLTFFYVRGLGETHPADRRAPHSAKSVMQAYWRLTLDKRFILPTLSMSLLMSGLIGIVRRRSHYTVAWHW